MKKNQNAQQNKQYKKELKWVFANSRKHWDKILLIALLGLLGTALGLAGSVASKYLVDSLTTHDSRLMWIAGIAMVALMLGSLVLSAVSSRVSTRIRVKLRNSNQRKAYKRILQAGWESLEPFRSGDLLHRLHADTNIVSEGIISLIPNMVSVGLRFMGALAIMLYFDATMALLVLLAMPATLLVSQLLVRPLRQHDQALKTLGGELMSFQEDSFRNLTSIKAFAITDRFTHDLRTLQDHYAKETLDMNRTQIRISVITTLLSALFAGGCLVWGAWRIWSGAMTYGSLAMFLQLMNTLRHSCSGILSLMQRMVTLGTSAGRMMAVEALPKEETVMPEGLQEEKTLSVELKQTAFSYQNGETVLHPFDFSVRAGETVAITGPSGEGKTTLLRLLLGLVEPRSGSAELVGEKRYRLSAGTRSVFSYVPQGNSIFAGTVAENLRLVNPDATDEELEKALGTACALDFVRQLPGGLEYRLGAGGRGISEGQAQRLAVARALLKKAPVLLLDEATSAMDVQMEGKLLENLRACDMVQTCILVTHRPGSMEFCDRSYEICDGVVTEVSYEG